MAKKRRADEILLSRALAGDIAEARALIMAGVVYIGEVRCDTPGQMLAEDAHIEVRDKNQKYVSRGGLKLEKAIETFGIDLRGAEAMDIGASTGGFTDCMLQNGAAKVYSVDVGYGQLAWKLRGDTRVVNMERTNIRFVERGQLTGPLDFVSVDVSFISLKLILPVMRRLMKETGQAAVLVKPQFEAAREQVGDKGVVTDWAVHREVIENCIGYALENGFDVCGLTYSPIKGPEGNIEYLLYLRCGSGKVPLRRRRSTRRWTRRMRLALARH